MERVEIRPTESEFTGARKKVEQQASRWVHSVDAEDLELVVNMQVLDRPVSVVTSEQRVILTLDLGGGWEENLEISVLRGLLECEYRQRIGEVRMLWQELKMMVYVEARINDIRDRDQVQPRMEGRWKELRSDLRQDETEMWREMGSFARELAGGREAEEVLEMGRGDLERLGDELYGGKG